MTPTSIEDTQKYTEILISTKWTKKSNIKKLCRTLELIRQTLQINFVLV